MQVTVAEVDALSLDVDVQVPDAQIEAEVTQQLKQLASRVRIDGFRPGKAPVQEVRRRYGQGARLEAIDRIVQKTMQDALRGESLRGVVFTGRPELVSGSVSGGGLHYRFRAEKMPKLEAVAMDGLAIEQRRIEVKAAEVEREIEQLRRSRSTVEPVEDRTVSERGDVVVLDVTVDSDGPESVLAGEGQEIDTSDPNLVAGLGDQLAGIEMGASRAVTLSLPPSFPEESLAGQDVEVTVTLTALKRRVLPELDDELAKDTGLCETAAELSSAIEARIRSVRENEVRRESRRAVASALVEANPVTLPSLYVEELARAEARGRMEEMARRTGMKLPEDYDPGELVDAVRPLVTSTLAETVIVDSIARAESITVGDEDVDRVIAEVAQAQRQPVAKVRASLGRDNGLDRLRSSLRRERVLDFVLTRASITEVDATPPSED
jgi:trigger factor